MPKRKGEVTSVEATLAERGRIHGEFTTHAVIAQALKAAMHASPFWAGLADDSKEALEMIAHKLARILNGGETCSDSYHDIAGYAVLVERRLLAEGKK